MQAYVINTSCKRMGQTAVLRFYPFLPNLSPYPTGRHTRSIPLLPSPPPLSHPSSYIPCPFFSPSFWISLHIRSEARASPPGESTLSTTAAIFLSLPKARSWGITPSGVMAPEAPPPPDPRNEIHILSTAAAARSWVVSIIKRPFQKVDL